MSDSPTSPAPVSVGDLFRRRPPQWGTRGDVYLWARLQERLAATPAPESWLDLRGLLERECALAIGQPLRDAPAQVYVREFDPGSGISAGQVSPRWWADTGIPILLDRAEAAREHARF